MTSPTTNRRRLRRLGHRRTGPRGHQDLLVRPGIRGHLGLEDRRRRPDRLCALEFARGTSGRLPWAALVIGRRRRTRTGRRAEARSHARPSRRLASASTTFCSNQSSLQAVPAQREATIELSPQPMRARAKFAISSRPQPFSRVSLETNGLRRRARTRIGTAAAKRLIWNGWIRARPTTIAEVANQNRVARSGSTRACELQMNAMAASSPSPSSTRRILLITARSVQASAG